LANKFFGTEITLISLIDRERQWFKSRCGLAAAETPREISFCGHAILEDETFIVNDASKDERFHDNPLVAGDPKIRFYAGEPLRNSDGFAIGTLCVISATPREMTEDEVETLGDLGRMVELVLQNRVLGESQLALLDELDTAKRDSLLDPLSGLWNRAGFDRLFESAIARAIRDKDSLAVALIDIDKFKNINDTFGHAKGDEAIVVAGGLLTRTARPSDIVARYGGEKFVFVAPGIVPATLPSIGEKIMRIFRTRARLQTAKGDYPFTASAGLALYHSKAGAIFRAKAMLEAADKALSKAKANGRDRYEVSADLNTPYSGFTLA
jgi:diguanylate cyclase (GGDEF)-like protein